MLWLCQALGIPLLCSCVSGQAFVRLLPCCLPAAVTSVLTLSLPRCCRTVLQVQFGNEVAIINSGVVAAVVRAETAAPHLLAIRPVALVAASRGPEPEQGAESGGQEMLEGATAFTRTFGEGTVALWGYGIAGPENDVICRQQGRRQQGSGCLWPLVPCAMCPSMPSHRAWQGVAGE